MPSKAGFTLIELIVVVVIMGLLASIAIRQTSRAQEQAFVSSLKGDLRNFALGQESYFYDNGTYTSNVTLISAGGFQPSPAVQITVVEATNTGWSAYASHPRTTERCYLYGGNAAPIGTATETGLVDCS